MNELTDSIKIRSGLRRWGGFSSGVSLLTLLLSLETTACDPGTDSNVSARTVTQRSELIGGDRSLGDLGDTLLENDQIRLIIQQPGFSRGFGVYGGSLIDADLRRPDEAGDSSSGKGFDALGEIFPALFVQAVQVDTVEILNDGSDGNPARVSISGGAGDFLELLAVLNRAVTGSNQDYLDRESEDRLRYETIYELEPGRRSVKVTFGVENISEETMAFPSIDAVGLLGLLGLPSDGFTVPVGDVALFGATSKVFMPGVGFDVRFSLDEAYGKGIEFPAFPGIVTDFIAARANNVSYGLLAEESERNYVWNKRDQFETADTPVTRSSMLVPFVASAFLGIFYDEAPPELTPGQRFESVKHVVLGTGDVGSVLDGIYDIQGTPTGKLSGLVFDQFTGQPAEDARVLVSERTDSGQRRPLSEYQVMHGGAFGGNLAPGLYSARITGEGRVLGDWMDFQIDAGEQTSLTLTANSGGRIVVNIRGEHGEQLPAKATLVGWSPAEQSNVPPRRHLFNLTAGEEFRSTDFVADDPADPSTRRYIEATEVTSNGFAEIVARPGEYEVYSSRGPEYDLSVTKINLKAGDTVNVTATLRRVVDTKGWIAADTHLHSISSIDSGISFDDRVLWAAAEGVEWGVATDHNFVTDLSHYVARNDLEEWFKSSVGIELTTLESGHFNAFPLNYQVGPVTHGSFRWSGLTPDEIFSTLRGLGDPDQTLVQVNHPRDSILGYFDQYNQHGIFGEIVQSGGFIESFVNPTGPAFLDENGESTFSRDFDLMEVTNGRLFHEIHHYRVPETLPSGELPEEIPDAGTVLLDADGAVAFPGVVDDWYNLLNQDSRKVGLGVSDSHDTDEEVGYFRTFVFVDDDNPSNLSDEVVMSALRRHRAVATNGPLVTFYINDSKSGMIGSELVDEDGTVDLTVRVTAAPWISVSRLNIVRNGLIGHSINIDPNRDLSTNPYEETIQIDLEPDLAGSPRDSWFVVEAIGNRSYFPIVKPLELPPLLLTDAVGSLAGPLGFGNESGALQPAQVFPVTAYAITNPVWVKTDSGDFDPPGVKSVSEQIAPENDPGFRVTASGILDADSIYTGAQSQARVLDPVPGSPTDIRNILSSLAHCQSRGL